MRRVETFALALALAIGVLPPARGADLPPRDPAQSFAGSGLFVRSEMVRHQKRRYLLIRIEPAAPAMHETAFRPVTVACERMTVQTARETLLPDLPSLCRDSTTLRGLKAPPLFVAFRDPGKGDVTLSVPVRVLPPAPPVMTSLERERRSRNAERPAVPAENRTLTARIHLPD